MRTNTNQYRREFNKHVITWCENDDQKITTVKEAYQYIKERFYSEFKHKQTFAGFVEWLEGLALNTPFTYVDILSFAKELGSLPDNATEKQEDKIIENFFPFIANKIVIYSRKEGINIF